MNKFGQLSAGILQMANQAMRNEDYCRAIALYIQYTSFFPELATTCEFNTALARRRGLSSLATEKDRNPKKRRINGVRLDRFWFLVRYNSLFSQQRAGNRTFIQIFDPRSTTTCHTSR